MNKDSIIWVCDRVARQLGNIVWDIDTNNKTFDFENKLNKIRNSLKNMQQEYEELSKQIENSK